MSNDRGGRPADRVLLLGLDGLAESFLAAPLVQESTPNLTAFLRGTARGPLASTFPPYTGPAWTTITTGVGPGRHGIFGFTDADGRPVSDTGVGSPRIWDYVGASGGRSVVVNVPITYPPRKVEGVLVSGMPSPPGAQYTFPADVAAPLEEMGYVVDVSVGERARDGRSTMERLTQMTEARGRATVQLAQTNDWDLFAVIFVLPDRLGHPWWKFLVPGHSQYESRAGEKVRRGARDALVALDRAIGELLATIPSGTAVVLCSDHGFGPLRADIFFDLVLAREGLMDAPQARTRQIAAKLGRSRVGRFAPQPLHGWAKRRAASNEGNRRVWTTPGYESGVRLADPADDAARALARDLLFRLRDPEGGPVVKRVVEREQLYTGPRSSYAPDLLCEMTEESVNLHDGLHASSEWVSREDDAFGTHMTEGVVAIQGAVRSRADLRGEAADICPTVLNMLGLHVDSLDGNSLVSADPSDLTSVSISPAEVSDPQGSYSEDQEAAVLEHLRGLGYVE
jgi:predicted AlkP superfamily phosphohydrolase/phosphomutase